MKEHAETKSLRDTASEGPTFQGFSNHVLKRSEESRVAYDLAADKRESSPLETQVGGSHYKDMPIQPVEFCQTNGLRFCEASAIKYICRHRNKNGRQDLEKAIHFLQMLVAMQYGEK